MLRIIKIFGVLIIIGGIVCVVFIVTGMPFTWDHFFVVSQLIALWATIFGVVVGVIVLLVASRTYKQNSSIQRWKLIQNLYTDFLKEDWYEFYKRIENGKEIDFINVIKDEKLLNETLTLFDAINYLRTQNLIDDGAWEYIACELHNFDIHKSVGKYIAQKKKFYEVKEFPEDLIPFTGFPDLINNIPCKFRRKDQPCRFRRKEDEEIKCSCSRVMQTRRAFKYWISKFSKR